MKAAHPIPVKGEEGGEGEREEGGRREGERGGEREGGGRERDDREEKG